MKLRSGGYANVASTLALVVALGGTSYAAMALPKNSVASPQIVNGSVTTKDVKNGALKAVDFKAGQLPAGAQGPAGPAGPQGPAGPAGTARAYAMVTGGASPVLSRNKGFTAVTHSSTGIYCLALAGFDPTTTPWFASVDWLSTAGPEGNASALVARGICPASHPVGILTERIDPATGSAVPADNVAFTVMVP